ncbi:unnamed protein product [Adineta ricciae]|uniref:RBR-type E3 ubiquitin transferase n=1 Tax=Adineta ricciae TaxID=249248 RepID=A0A815M4E2_ADIRI|nr:unnamed protein product [Adineta ricciae]CAF1415438.1 unnamed protein product [Adineta ricciae]
MASLSALSPDYIAGLTIISLLTLAIIFVALICCIAKRRRDPETTGLLPSPPPRHMLEPVYDFVPRTCQVCFDEKFSYAFGPPLTAACRHIHQTICNTCVLNHVEKAFEEICRDDVRCPEPDCGALFDYDAVKNILNRGANKRLFDRYDRFITNRHIEQMDEFVWCSNPDCGMGQLNDGGQANNIVTCFNCHKRTCFTHRVPWHEGLTCAEYDQTRNADDEASQLWIIQNSKKCPNCPYRIEKNDGCDHMKCVKCSYEFCWSCLADYERIRKDGNHRHHPNCKHYAPYDET